MDNNIKVEERVNNIIITVNNKSYELNKKFIDELVLKHLEKKEYFLALDVYKSKILEWLDNEFECLEFYYKYLKAIYPVYMELQQMEYWGF